MTILKKIYSFLVSMKFAITLLILVVVGCVLGSLIPQGYESAFYLEQYGDRVGMLICIFYLDQVFHCWWFIVLTAMLCLSVLLCNLTRVRALIRKTKDAARPEIAVRQTPDVSIATADPESVFRRLHMYRPAGTAVDGKETLFMSRNRIGFWGAWICHFGIVLIVIGYALGQMTLFDTMIHGLPGETLAIDGTPYTVTVNDFRVERNETGFIKQYSTDLCVTDASGHTRSATSGVNSPAKVFGYKFYQEATGQVANVTLYDAGESLGTRPMAITDILLKDTDSDRLYSVGTFDANGYYHLLCYDTDLTRLPEGDRIVRPGERIQMLPEMEISEPIDTLLRVKKDSFAWLVLVGAILTTLGLFIALYLVPETVWAVQGEDGTWTINGKSRKLAPLFKEQFDRAVSGRKGKEAVK